MSMGVAVVNALVKQASRMLDQDFVVKMKETHHTKKLDAPSGTAVMLRNSVNEFREQKVEIESIREGEVVGEHAVTFVSQLEKIKIKHEAFSRSVFADGALKCALWLSTRNARKSLRYG
jgi:4-hydroxy-tetrahydrodipicolinate reductase